MSNAAASAGGPLLCFEGVGKGYPNGQRRTVVLAGASFEIHRGDRVGVLGARRAGKSTLLRLAAGVEAPDSGRILFDGVDVARMRQRSRDQLLRRRIGLLVSDHWWPAKGERVVDLVALPLVSDGATLHEAHRRARRTLHRVGVAECADDPAASLAVGERMRAMLLDEPAVVPSPRERSEFYELVRACAREYGAALVVASEDAEAVRETDLLMSIGGGELVRTGGVPGVVVPLRARQAAGQERAVT
jgi:ABC-type methionine transport system ATPase subunit